MNTNPWVTGKYNVRVQWKNGDSARYEKVEVFDPNMNNNPEVEIIRNPNTGKVIHLMRSEMRSISFVEVA